MSCGVDGDAIESTVLNNIKYPYNIVNMETKTDDIILQGYVAHNDAPAGCPSCKVMVIMFVIGFIIGVWSSPHLLRLFDILTTMI